MHDLASQHSRAHRMKLELEGRNDAEVAPTAPHAPEQVLVLRGAGSQDVASRGDHLDGEQVVAGEAVLASKAAHPAAEPQPPHTGMSDDARRGGQSKSLRLPVEITQKRP